MIKIQQTEAEGPFPAKTNKVGNKAWEDIVVENTYEAALNTLIGQLNTDVVDTCNKWFRVTNT